MCGGHLGLCCHLARCLCSRISTPQLRDRRQLLKHAQARKRPQTPTLSFSPYWHMKTP
jgi:hypothetical protein